MGERTPAEAAVADAPPLTTAVRFGFMRHLGEFTYTPEIRFTPGARLVIQTQRGIELGEHVPLTCGRCDRAVTSAQIKGWLEVSGNDSYVFGAGRILREATAADLAEYARIQSSSREKRAFAQRIAQQWNLAIKVVDCECPFGGERIVFYFTAAERVDFRAMVKDLAKEYRTRIEMRQIGARDEARLVADYETCGREVCCKSFLKTLKPVNMRMAKVQKATLDPSQVSGRCGRLKCCLRYEHLAYEDLDKRLPRTGVRIRTTQGVGVVVNRQVLTQLVQFRTDGDTLVTVGMEEVTAVGVPPESADGMPLESPPDASPVPTRPVRVPKGHARPSATRPRLGASPQAGTTAPTGSTVPPTSATQGEVGRQGENGGEQQPARRRRRRQRRQRPAGPRRSSRGGGPGTAPPGTEP